MFRVMKTRSNYLSDATKHFFSHEVHNNVTCSLKYDTVTVA